MKRMIKASTFQAYDYSELTAAANNAKKLRKGIVKVLNDSKISESDVPYVMLGQEIVIEYDNNPKADGVITLVYAVVDKSKTQMKLNTTDRYGLVNHFTSLVEYQEWANSPQMQDKDLKTLSIEVLE